MSNLVCVGDIMVDVRVVLPGPLALGSDTPALISVGHGGSAANTAAWVGREGSPVQFFGRVGNDLYGAEAEAALVREGVRPQLAQDETEPTGTCVVLISPDGERTMIPSAGANERLVADDLVGAEFGAGDQLHLSGYTLLRDRTRSAAIALMARAISAGAGVSVDASSSDPLRRVGAEAFLRWLPTECLLLANADEAAVLTGVTDEEEAALLLRSAGLARVVVKGGANGAVVADARGCVRVDAKPADVLDTTGAGDAFAAGLLVGLASGDTLATAAERGNSLAGLAVTQWGPRPADSSEGR